MTDHPKCIDISHWQGFPDFAKVKAAGVIACILKASEGVGYVDPNRRKNYGNATRQGIKCCTYHWLKPGNAKAQMAFYLNTVDPIPGERMIIDYEENGCVLGDLLEAVQTLKADPRKLQVTVYSGHLLKQQLGDNRNEYLAANTDLWLAQYTTGEPSWPNETYPRWALWQYSEKGVVDGITGSAVDLDRFNGDDAALLKWISPQVTIPPDVGTVGEVAIDIRVPDGVSVSLNVNGEPVFRS